MWDKFFTKLPFFKRRQDVTVSRFSDTHCLLHIRDRQGVSTQRLVSMDALATQYTARIVPLSFKRRQKQIVVTLPDSSGSVQDYILGPFKERRAQKELSKILSQAKQSSDRSAVIYMPKRKRWFWRMFAVFVVILGVLAITPYPEEALDERHPVIDQASLVSLPKETLGSLALVSAQAGIEVMENRSPVTAKFPVYVFAYPSCKECASLIEALPWLPEKYKPIVMPAGFSFDMGEILNVATAYCSEDSFEAWRTYSRGEEPAVVDITQCADWVQKAQASTLISDMMGVASSANDWPVVVTPNGKVSSGAYPDEAYPTLIDLLERNLF